MLQLWNTLPELWSEKNPTEWRLFVLRSSPVRNESVVVTWEQLSDVWLDKRKLGARCDSSLMSVLWGPTTPSRGSTAYSLSGPLCCEWQWSRLLREAWVHARAHNLNPRILTERHHEQNAVSWFKTKWYSKSVVSHSCSRTTNCYRSLPKNISRSFVVT